ncbi:hypothetical protein ECG_00418 [Echinococcus granulosus]|uniref:Alternative protein n=1 Tax=Echinococcus granulosus TaxID=6210 RepID=A0A068WUT2_ECHGR|nr:hypothetical protein ECG_00418 [Echinococcus granulosus]CDS23590.1 hypothetical protein EgrG_002043100 [Echinococcus granulosus]
MQLQIVATGIRTMDRLRCLNTARDRESAQDPSTHCGRQWGHNCKPTPCSHSSPSTLAPGPGPNPTASTPCPGSPLTRRAP